MSVTCESSLHPKPSSHRHQPGSITIRILTFGCSVARILDICKELASEDACLDYLERLRWPSGVQCVKCSSQKISRIMTHGKSGKPRHLYQCLACRAQFTIRTGTIFQDSHLPLTSWFKAIALIAGPGGGAKDVNV